MHLLGKGKQIALFPLSPGLPGPIGGVAMSQVERVHHNSLANIPDIAFADLHVGVFVLMLAAWAWLFAVLWLTFGTQLEGGFMVGISTGYVLMYFAVPAAMIKTAKKHTPHLPDRRGFGDFLRGHIQIATGSMKGWEATVQILLVPVGLALCISGIALAVIAARGV